VYLYDAEGREYLDLISGVGVAALGHAHPGLAGALADQARTLLHCSNLFYHPLQGQLAERLAILSGLPRAFFCNSGTEAVETCLKFARRYWHTRGPQRGAGAPTAAPAMGWPSRAGDSARGPERVELVALEGSFHGRTYGSLSVTADPHYRQPFEPLLPRITFVPRNDPARLRDSVTSATAAIILEPIQGESGIYPLSAAFAQAVNEACGRTGALLIADEVQCGLGRTGNPFCFDRLGLKPQLVAIGKALGAGVPIGAALVHEDIARAISAGDHGSTYGGNLLACRAALFFLDQLERGGLLAHVGRVGTHLEMRLRALASRHPSIVEVRGAGLMWGIELNVDAAPVVHAAITRGLLVNRTGGTIVRLLPPFIITEAEIDRGVEALDAALGEVRAGAPRAESLMREPRSTAETPQGATT
jgi:acetylornithine/succinyldiaminopimelate/putrescine aminotransferase